MNGLGRKLMLVLLDTVLLSTAYVFAFWLRLDTSDTVARLHIISQTLPVVLILSLFVHLRHGLFNAILRYASIDTAVAVFKSVFISVLLSSLVLFLLFRLDGVPRSVFIIYGMTALILVGASRLAVRVRQTGIRAPDHARKLLLYGAADTAELVLRGLRVSRELDYVVIGLLDDDPAKHGRRIHGVEIVGGVESLARIVRNSRIDELWVCIPNLIGERLRKLYETTSSCNVRIKILPKLEHALLGTDLGLFHEPDISDLLRRPPRQLDRDRMRQWIRGRRVLITGAGGSIGRELSRQVCKLGPASVALCDCSEENLFEVHRELVAIACGADLHPFLVNVCDREAVHRMFHEARPDVVFHAAAYKHVPLVEMNPCQGVLTNVQGLAHVAEEALERGVREFVFISTDKAVRPANIMGVTKRLGEKIIQALNREGKTRYMAVRFGNVLGSSGSVVPIFLDQIRRGCPVTVTHPDMTRFFMLVSEAVELVIQAGSIGRGGETFVLDMGEPVRIQDMARDLILLMGKEPGRDVKIEFVGPRPGEKIHEELLITPRDSRTAFPDIWIDGEPDCTLPWSDLQTDVRRLLAAAETGDDRRVVRGLKRLCPRFDPVHVGTRCLLDPDESAFGRAEAPSEIPVSSPGN
jgi:FlaA1/EpsC-like NDP-sugar epimerase